MNWSHYLVGIWFCSYLVNLYIIIVQELIPNTLNMNIFTIFCIAFLGSCTKIMLFWLIWLNIIMLTGRLFRLVCCLIISDEIIIYSNLLPYEQEFYLTLVWVITSLGISHRKQKIITGTNLKTTNVAPTPYCLL
ncbi:AVN_HP_G0120170.mRNA.1.CDS.1 [Saccharomyces cerevisiae]|nr:AVN_HP_G0120170.mRNA.1.CDS.1 [Saccharomyces cerevisiae]CAI6997249.1 AVN_HP_G0120170.mRNA.1.CDS.1 [Saccharomyces cerevisiae]